MGASMIAHPTAPTAMNRAEPQMIVPPRVIQTRSRRGNMRATATTASPVATPAKATFANHANGPASEATGIRIAPAIVPTDASNRPGRSQTRCSFLGWRSPAAASARYPIPVTTLNAATVCEIPTVNASASAATPTTANTIASGNADASVPMNRYQTSPSELQRERVMTDTIDASGSVTCS